VQADVGIDLARAHGRWRVTSPALSIARWGHISTVATFHEAPLRSRTAGFPGSGSGLGPARHFPGSGLPSSRWSLSSDTHPLHSEEICSRPRPNARAALAQLCVWVHTNKSRPPSAQSPFARRLVGASSRNAWESVTSPSSLIWTHAPDHAPPGASVSLGRLIFAGCCRSLLEHGPSRRYPCTPCVGAWTHTPPSPSGARAHFFPEGLGLAPRETCSADETISAMQLQQRAVFSGLQPFASLQAPTLARPPGCTHRG
jgi:hypothetical protein